MQRPIWRLDTDMRAGPSPLRTRIRFQLSAPQRLATGALLRQIGATLRQHSDCTPDDKTVRLRGGDVVDDASPDLVPLSQALSDLLSSFRDGAGLTQKQLGDRVGYARVTVATAEGGQRIPAEAFWNRCDDVLGANGALRGAYGQLVAARRVRMSQRLQADRALNSTDSKGFDYLPPPTGQRDRAVQRRRAGTATVAPAPPAFPIASIGDLRHIAAAVKDSRYVDGALIGILRGRVAAYAADDGAVGPKRTLPAVLAVLAIVDDKARDVPLAARHELLAFGARVAEFAGWLYRDVDAPAVADHWRDRAMEWAAEAGDTAMQGYVLVKKSQSAWDDRDAYRMLSLAQAAQNGPWQLPPKAMAEAVQQEARGQAMTGAPIVVVERKLEEAQAHLARAEQEDVAEDEPGSHYTSTLLTLQIAMCYQEVGKFDRAVDLFDTALAQATLSLRDRGYFRSLQACALADGGAPDAAVRVGVDAYTTAEATGSARTAKELRRLTGRLQPWRTQPEVREFMAAVHSS